MTVRNRVIFVVTTTLAICAAYAGYLLNTRSQLASPPALAQQALQPIVAENVLGYWSFSDLTGQERQMTEWAGKIVLINFWATWCGPCRHEIPSFVALQRRYADAGVQFVGVALDRPQAVTEFAEEYAINYPLLIGEENVAQYMRALGNEIGALPFSALIDREGKVIETHQGEWQEGDIDALIVDSL